MSKEWWIGYATGYFSAITSYVLTMAIERHKQVKHRNDMERELLAAEARHGRDQL